MKLTTKADKVTVVATFDPNGYTTIVRTRKVDAKEGEIEVDLSEASDKECPTPSRSSMLPTPRCRRRHRRNVQASPR